MKEFLIDNKCSTSYNTLLEDINNSTYYCPVFKSIDLYQYFVNLTVALLSDRPLFLIDSDLNNEEINVLGVNNEVNKKYALDSHFYFKSIEDVIQNLLSSDSKITLFTSGTTGQPKEVIHTVRNLTRNVRKSDKYKSQIWAFAYNPTHMAGLQVFFQAIANENTLVNVFNKNREFVFKAIEKNEITHISATPTFYRLLLPIENSYVLVQRVTFGGEKSDTNLYDSMLKLFPNAKINNIYASTEAGSLFASRGDTFQIPVSIIDKIKVENDELMIHRSLLGESNSFEFTNDYYNTGDLIEWVDQTMGLFKFKSRKNELINVGGYKINPQEVEETILAISGVIQCIVYGKSNSVLGNVLCAEIKKVTSSELSETEVRKLLSNKLQDFKIPRRIKFVNEFTLTRTGKIKRV